jgi:hypothetical protein
MLAGLFPGFGFILHHLFYRSFALSNCKHISIVLVVLELAVFWWAAYGGISSSRGLRKELFAKYDPETSFIEPLYHAFHPSKNGFESSQSDALENFYEDLRRQRKKLLTWIIPGILTFVLLLPAFFFLHPAFAENPIRKNLLVKTGLVMSDEQKAQVAGIWQGTFDDRPSTLEINPFTADSITEI